MILRKKKLNHLIAGFGEIGAAIHTLLDENGVQSIDISDMQKGFVYAFGAVEKKQDVIHICFPFYNEDALIFIEECKRYEKELADGGIIIIHSTVPVGTTTSLGNNYVHSPVRGVHPNLYESLKVFVKYFGGARAREASTLFKRYGLHVRFTSVAENTEAMKLWETEQYRRFIGTMQEIHEFCDAHHLDFDLVYTESNNTYNDGYTEMGMEHVTRPVLFYMPGPIGGHCVEPNHVILFGEDKQKPPIRKRR